MTEETQSSGNAAYRSGYYFEFHDENQNGMVDSGDLVHVYGQKMMSDVLVLDVVGYSGNMQVSL